ncbi:G protein gamma domain-containing protein [Heracleum sosnowskyi]|uniref:G protein gamma domain-containing protein n=1 Tax=Heracleum sosnowskyi TaxID=360622 RepID=A0AAD8HCT2_9APIA|nr:G protein gamma domain-containing protein [Heracleum sosnowskyi]
MDGAKRGSSIVPSLPPPSPKSPPDYSDLYGKRRELALVQMLDREIGFLEEEIKSVGRIQTASHSCKEVADFVMANSDPLITPSCKIRRSRRIWRWLCGKAHAEIVVIAIVLLAQIARALALVPAPSVQAAGDQDV